MVLNKYQKINGNDLQLADTNLRVYVQSQMSIAEVYFQYNCLNVVCYVAFYFEKKYCQILHKDVLLVSTFENLFLKTFLCVLILVFN